MFGSNKLNTREVAEWTFMVVSSSGGNHHNLRDLFKKNIHQIYKGERGLMVGQALDKEIMHEYLDVYEEQMKMDFAIKYLPNKESNLIIDISGGKRHPKEANYKDFWPNS